MSESNPYQIFVSHNWQKNDDYLRVFEYLEATDKFFYLNLSDPEKIPDDVSKEGLRAALRDQADGAEVMILLTSMVKEHRDQADYLIKMAKAMAIPIICIKLYGSEDVTPEIRQQADVVVDWNTIEIVDAVKAQARGEDVERWDVVEFDPNL